MGSFSNYFANRILDHVFIGGASAYTPPTTYIALLTADPGATGDVTGKEPTQGAYARKSYSVWSAPANRQVSNTNQIYFDKATANWGAAITHYAIMDAASGGNCLVYGALQNQKTVVTGNTPFIGASEIIVSMNASTQNRGFTTYFAHKVLAHVFGGTTFASPAASLWVGLSTTDPIDDGTNTTEPAGNNYSRVQCVSWAPAATGKTSNATLVTFSVPSGTWGTITSTVLFDAGTGGNKLMFGQVAAQEPVAGDPVSFPIGDFSVTLS